MPESLATVILFALMLWPIANIGVGLIAGFVLGGVFGALIGAAVGYVFSCVVWHLFWK